jgi:hypothetical protein
VLSCYTTNLIGHLRRENPRVDAEFATAVELAVRTDLPGGVLAFSQHRRIDPGLGYRSATTWEDTKGELLAEFEHHGDVLAVASTRNLPWSPSHGAEDTPHWIRLTDRRGDLWLVVDEFDALLPHGEQHPYEDWAGDRELRAMLTPLPPLPPEVHHRDVHALGDAVRVPPPHSFRWLSCSGDGTTVRSGQWIRGTTAALRHLSERFAEDIGALRGHTEDLWAAGRHHQYRFAHDDAVTAAWGELSRSLRFAIQSADRGRPRPTLITRAFEQVISATSTLEVSPQ